MTEITSLGIIGYGRFGALLARHMKDLVDVSVYTSQEHVEHGTKSSWEDVCRCDVIVPAVPISEVEETLKKMKDSISENAIIMDVCSVKQLPCEWMTTHLSCKLVASHPLFGPDTANDSFSGRKLMIHPLSIDEQSYESVKQLFSKKELELIECTPQEHDEAIAQSLFLTHFIGRTLIESDAKPEIIDTQGYQRLLHILETVQNDTWQLFQDMYSYNPSSQKILKRFMDSAQTIQDKVTQ